MPVGRALRVRGIVKLRPLAFLEPPETRGAVVTQDRTVTAGEHRRHPGPLAAQLPASDRVDPAMDRMQPTPRDPVADRLRAEPKVLQLPPSDHTVLAAGQLPGSPRPP